MTYGLTCEDLKQPHDVETIKAHDFGTIYDLTPKRSEYALQKLYLSLKKAQPYHLYANARGVYFLEEGELLIRTLQEDGSPQYERLMPQHLFELPARKIHSLCALKESVVYFFKNQDDTPIWCETVAQAQQMFSQLCPYAFQIPLHQAIPSDFREKYWGSICTIVSEEFAGKRLVLKKNTQSSLEFHCHKVESYYLHSGLIKIGLRIGRGENTSILLEAGKCYDITPGLMHMRLALEDSVLIEISTRDSDKDSHLVEDGQCYTHLEKF